MRTETKVSRGGDWESRRQKSEIMKGGRMVAAAVLGGRAAEALIFNPPHCALPGLQVSLFCPTISICCSQVGAGLGTVAGAFGGVAAAGDHSRDRGLTHSPSKSKSVLSGTGGAATLATCPSLAITTLAGSGMIGPAAPLVALLTGALLGGVAGGTAGGVYTCKVGIKQCF